MAQDSGIGLPTDKGICSEHAQPSMETPFKIAKTLGVNPEKLTHEKSTSNFDNTLRLFRR